jgi:hypothetical protein
MLNTSASAMSTMKSWLIIAVLLAGCLCVTSYAGTGPAKKAHVDKVIDSPNQPPTNLPTSTVSPAPVKADADYLSPREFSLALLVTAVSLVALLMQFFLLRSIPKLKAEDLLRTFGVVLIIMGTLFFIAAGFSSAQIAPALGLFGTIAGYLLGRVEKKREEEKNA